MNQEPNPKRTRRFRKRPLAISLILLCMVGFFVRHPVLRFIGAALVHKDLAINGADILVISGDGASRNALQWLAEFPDAKLLLTEKRPPRVVQIGATKSDAQRRRELSAATGISDNRIEILIGNSMRAIRPSENIKHWLSAHPQRHVHVLSDQFQSRSLRRSLNRDLKTAMAERVSIQPLPDRRYLMTNWWTSRLGLRTVFDAYLGLSRSVLGLRSPEPPTYLTPDQYEEAFLRSLDAAS